jgi:hypothetical protein
MTEPGQANEPNWDRLEAELAEGADTPGANQARKTAAFHLLRELRKTRDAAAIMGLNTARYHQMVGWADMLNHYINPPDLSRIRRRQHGDPSP